MKLLCSRAGKTIQLSCKEFHLSLLEYSHGLNQHVHALRRFQASDEETTGTGFLSLLSGSAG